MSKSIKVQGGRIYQTRFGTYMAYSYANGRRHRKCFSSFSSAESWLQTSLRPEDLPPLTNAQYLDAQLAIAKLPPGTSLEQLVESYRSTPSAAHSVCISTAFERFIESKTISSAPLTLLKYKSVCNRFMAKIGRESIMDGITSEEISAFVEQESPANRNSMIRHLSSFFSWSKKHDFVTNNPCVCVERARIAPTSPGILSIEEARTVLETARKEKQALVAYFAIGLFAGIRPEEIRRLKPDDFKNGHIVLSAAITKTANARTVPIRPNLAAWLAIYPPDNLHSATPAIIKTFHKKCPIGWSPDCLRHSFATYAYELTRDANLIASEMGHAGTGVFFRHYRALATPGDGEKFFSIFP